VACSSVSHRDPQRADLHLQIGTGYLSKGLYPQAMQELLHAEEYDPDNPVILNNLGLAYFVRGRLKTAEEKFRKALRFSPKFSEAKNNLGRLLIDAGRTSEALKILHEVENDLTYEYQEKTYSNLGMAYFNLGQFQKAEEYLLKSLEIRRDNCATASFYGRTLYEEKRLEASAQALDQAIEFCRSSRYEEPIFFSAMSYFSLGNKEKSRARIEELLKDYPKSKYYAKAKGMLELLQQ
jgi:Tfp pilus assembly protein PilF